jgi:hypothetical protein
MAFGVTFDPDPRNTAKSPRNAKLGRETVSLDQGGFRLAMIREVER